MNIFVETLYKTNLYPLNNDIKYNIYTQFYKHISMLPKHLKQDIQTVRLIDNLISVYKLNSDLDDDIFLVHLYNDLIHEHYTSKDPVDIDIDRLVNNDLTNRFLMNTFHNINRSVYSPFIISRIKYFWKLLTPKKRMNFILNKVKKNDKLAIFRQDYIFTS